MALEQKLSLKLAQRLVMTPSLQQAIKLLQMTRLELEGVLTQELVENPVLEENEPYEEASPADGDAKEEAEKEAEKEEEALSDIDLEAFFGDHQESWEGSGHSSVFEERQGPPLENTLTREDDLYDHLLWQLHMMSIPSLQREIAELIIGNLDPEGFLVATVEEIQEMGADGYVDHSGGHAADDHPLDASGEEGANGYRLEDVEEALELVRSFDPSGVACGSLQESLLRQLDAEDEPEDSLARYLVEQRWESFTRRKFEAIAKELEIPLAALKPAVEKISQLNTRPGRKFSTERTHYVEPDVHIVKVGDSYVVQLNDNGLPRLRVSRAYRKMLQAMRQQKSEAEAQAFIKDKMRSAVWLIKSLDQRQRTIYKVSTSIVQQQRAFFDHGVEHLRPMVLRDVAEDIEMHESTVSRVVSNKYMHTPRGLLPMKFFFHSGIDRDYGGDISSLTVKRKIEHFIQGEDAKKPLSDSELMRILNREGIHIARRTVAKYRDELGIPSSTDRKQIF
ncbi:MAG: RNA polymerase factor sigma-54 [bacterium]|nr:RNA polymerase factor sigma-54 [bacterium]